jgi:hypothetical protein
MLTVFVVPMVYYLEDLVKDRVQKKPYPSQKIAMEI